jgi:hypothetical protein
MFNCLFLFIPATNLDDKKFFEIYPEHFEEVFTWLKDSGHKLNLTKFMSSAIYLTTGKGVISMLKTVEAVMNIAKPKTRTQVRSFIAMVNYYRDMWAQQSHFLEYLSSLTSAKVENRQGKRNVIHPLIT